MRIYHYFILKQAFLFSFVAGGDSEELFIRLIKAGIIIIPAMQIDFPGRLTGAQQKARFDQAFKLNILIYGRSDSLIEQTIDLRLTDKKFFGEHFRGKRLVQMRVDVFYDSADQFLRIGVLRSALMGQINCADFI